jgi:hypothetical protein
MSVAGLCGVLFIVVCLALFLPAISGATAQSWSGSGGDSKLAIGAGIGGESMIRSPHHNLQRLQRLQTLATILQQKIKMNTNSASSTTPTLQRLQKLDAMLQQMIQETTSSMSRTIPTSTPGVVQNTIPSAIPSTIASPSEIPTWMLSQVGSTPYTTSVAPSPIALVDKIEPYSMNSLTYPAPTTTNACSVQPTIDPSFKAITSVDSCSSYLASLDQYLQREPSNGKPLCQHHKDLGNCEFNELVRKNCPETCSNAHPTKKRPPLSGSGIDVPCFPILTNTSREDRSKYLRAVLPLFAYQDDIDYAAITQNNVQSHLVYATANRERIPEIWRSNPSVFVAWNGVVAVVSPRPQRPTTKMTIKELRNIIECMNIVSYVALVGMMALNPVYLQKIYADDEACVLMIPSNKSLSSDPPTSTNFMNEWTTPKTIVEMALAYGLDRPDIWAKQRFNLFQSEGKFTPHQMDWKGFTEFWGNAMSEYDPVESTKAMNGPRNKLGEMLHRATPGVTKNGIVGRSILTQSQNQTSGGGCLAICSFQYLNSTFLIPNAAAVILHEMGHGVDGLSNNFSVVSDYKKVFDGLTKETTGYLSGMQWTVQEHFAEMFMRVVNRMYYDRLLDAMTSICVIGFRSDGSLTPPGAEMLVTSTDRPEWAKPADLLMKEFMI